MLQTEFEQLTGIKVSTEDFETIHNMYMEADDIDKQTFCKAYKEGDFLSIVPDIINSVKRKAQFEGYQEGEDEVIKYQNKIHELEMKLAEKDEAICQRDKVISEKDEQLQQNLEVLKKTIKEFINLGQYEHVSAFRTLFVFSGKSDKDWIQFLCETAKSNN